MATPGPRGPRPIKVMAAVGSPWGVALTYQGLSFGKSERPDCRASVGPFKRRPCAGMGPNMMELRTPEGDRSP